MSVFVATSTKRQITDKVWRVALFLGLALALVPLVLVIGYVIIRGAPALSVEFFTTDPTGAFFGDQGGVRSAILGTLEIF